MGEIHSQDKLRGRSGPICSIIPYVFDSEKRRIEESLSGDVAPSAVDSVGVMSTQIMSFLQFV